MASGAGMDEGPTLTELMLSGTADMDTEQPGSATLSLGASVLPFSSSKAYTHAPAPVPSWLESVAEPAMQDVCAAPALPAAAVSDDSRPMSLREKAKLYGWGKAKP